MMSEQQIAQVVEVYKLGVSLDSSFSIVARAHLSYFSILPSLTSI